MWSHHPFIHHVNILSLISGTPSTGKVSESFGRGQPKALENLESEMYLRKCSNFGVGMGDSISGNLASLGHTDMKLWIVTFIKNPLRKFKTFRNMNHGLEIIGSLLSYKVSSLVYKHFQYTYFPYHKTQLHKSFATFKLTL